MTYNSPNASLRRAFSYLLLIIMLPAGVSAQTSTQTQDQLASASTRAPSGSAQTLPDDDFKRWGLSLHAGASIPHGDFNEVFSPGPNFAVDLEYRINTTVSIEAIYGFHRFRGETFPGPFGPFTVQDLNLHQLSLNGKIYGGSSPTRPFFQFGGGAYWFQPGSTVRGGLNAGAGIQHDISSSVAVEGVYNFHNVFTSGSGTRFSTLQGGVRFRF